jgi:hypothetical protein
MSPGALVEAGGQALAIGAITDGQYLVRSGASLAGGSPTAGSTVRNGAGAPAAGLGADGDYYLDTTAGAWYQRAAGAWGLLVGVYTPADGSVTDQKVNATAAIGYQKLGQVPACRVYRSATDGVQTITTSSTTAINFPSERFDTDNMHDPVTNNTRITCVHPGLYLFGGTTYWAPSGTGTRVTQLRINTSTYIGQVWMAPAAAGYNPAQMVEALYQCAAGDYAELAVYHTAGANLDLQLNANSAPEFWAIRMSA